jgi:sulfofructose kinase
MVGRSPIYYDGLAVEAVDTTGAGDVFHGAFICGLVRGWTIDEVFIFANAVAGLKCRKPGGRSVPTLSEVEAYLGRIPPR